MCRCYWLEASRWGAANDYPQNVFFERWEKHQHFENMPIQIYWKFYHQKIKNFQIKKKNDIFILLLKT